MKKNIFFLMSLSLILLSACGEQVRSPAAMVSISSDGRYVLSSHYGRYLILWDVEKKKKTLLNRHTSIFSPYFIPDSHLFLWQDANSNTVFVQSVSGAVVETFNPGFPVYGHVMTNDLKHYVASKDNWSLYQRRGAQFVCIKESFGTEPGSARLLQLILNEQTLLTAGQGAYSGERYTFNIAQKRSDLQMWVPKHADYSYLDGLVLWDINNGKPLRKFIGLRIKGTGDLSPDARYIAAGDESIGLYLWETRFGKQLYSMDLPTTRTFKCYESKKCQKKLAEDLRTTKVIPDDFYRGIPVNYKTVAVKFIDEEGHLLRFLEKVNYATLYQVSSPMVKAYLDLGHGTEPFTGSVFDSANVIATAPKTRILVMGQGGMSEKGKAATGIIVYRFHPESLRLERLWAPEGPPSHRRIENKDNPWEA